MGISLGFLSYSTDPFFLILCQYHTVLIAVDVYYSVKSRRLVSPALFFFLKIVLAIQGLVCSHTNCESVFVQ